MKATDPINPIFESCPLVDLVGPTSGYVPAPAHQAPGAPPAQAPLDPLSSTSETLPVVRDQEAYTAPLTYSFLASRGSSATEWRLEPELRQLAAPPGWFNGATPNPQHQDL